MISGQRTEEIMNRASSSIRSRTCASQSDHSIITPASSLSLKSVLLHDWWLVKAEGKRISVAGFASRERLGTRVFYSAPISRRIDASTLETIDGITVTINGFINRSQMLQNGFALLVCNCFHLGFPYDWEEYVTQIYINESAERDPSTEKSRLNSISPSGAKANASFPLSLDKLPAIRLRDLVMHIPEDFENFIYGHIASKHSPEAANESPSGIPESKGDESVANYKRAKTTPMRKDDDDDMDTKGTETKELNPRMGVRTRSMYSLKNPITEKEQNLPLKSSVNCKNLRKRAGKKQSDGFTAQVAPSSPNRNNFGEDTSALEAGTRTIYFRQDKEQRKALVISGVRRSARLKIQKSYVGMARP